MAHYYRARLSLPGAHPLVRVFVRWRSRYFGALSIDHIALVNTNAATAYPLKLEDGFNFDRKHWRRDTVGSNVILTNSRAAPNASAVLTSRLVSSRDEANIIKHGTSPMEPVSFQAASQALVTDSHHAFSTRSGVARVTRLKKMSPTLAEYSMWCSSRCMLLQDELFYPGWNASIDGRTTPIVRTDFVIRGVDVPLGAHVVRLWFSPMSLYVGALISLLTAIALLVLFLQSRKRTIPKSAAASSLSETRTN